ncbi:hypothetical protein ECG_04266 [Echinococcus granulosus]|nr:hypothetical protein ECG_04266 [Echinococcus granulosus]
MYKPFVDALLGSPPFSSLKKIHYARRGPLGVVEIKRPHHDRRGNGALHTTDPVNDGGAATSAPPLCVPVFALQHHLSRCVQRGTGGGVALVVAHAQRNDLGTSGATSNDTPTSDLIQR